MHPTLAACEALGEQISALSAQLNAATCRLLALIAEFDERRGWAHDGCRSCAHWLNWKCGIGLTAAREKVRVAAALPALPKIRAAFAQGEISYSKVRAMTRVADPESEEYLLMIARHGTAAHMEILVRGDRRVQRQRELSEANRLHATRAVHWHYDEEGMLGLTARLAPEDGERLMQAVQAQTEQLRKEQHNAEQDASAESPFPAWRADALMQLLTERRETEVVVHVSAEVLQDETADGDCHLEHGPALPPRTLRRLCCDAGLVRLVEDAEGQPLDVGRKTRSVPPALHRALNARDKGCCFPGCAATRGVERHHITHWVDGGETSLNNLATLCHHHHRAVHELGFTLQRRGDGRLVFRRPDGTRIESSPPINTVNGCAQRALQHQHEARGIHIDATTGVTRWDGYPMDAVQAVEALLQAKGELNF